MEGRKRRMEGRKEGLAHLTPPLVHAPLQMLALREAEYSWRYPSPGAAWSSSSRSRAVCCGVWAVWGRWEPDQLLSSQTRVRKEGFRDRAAELPQPCVWRRVQLTGDTSGAVRTLTPVSRAKASEPALLGRGLCSVGGAHRGVLKPRLQGTPPGATSPLPRVWVPFPTRCLIFSRPTRGKCQNMVDLRLLLQSTDRFLISFSETQRDGHSPSDSPHPL